MRRVTPHAKRITHNAQQKSVDSNISFLRSVERRLKQSHVPSAAVEAERLVRHFSRLDRLDFFTGQKPVTLRARKSVEAALKARLSGKPLAYILKEADFFGLKFFVSPDVLTPRPETEILIEEALKSIPVRPPLKPAIKASAGPSAIFGGRRRMTATQTTEVLDLGTGCGCIAVSLTIQRPDCRMTALELSTKALKIARKNINSNGLEKKINLLKSDLFSVFGREKKAFFDLIVTNPPYVAAEDFSKLSKEVLSEPRLALDGGPKGLLLIHAILERAPYFMKPGAWLLMEIGKGQSKSLAKRITRDERFTNLKFTKDLNGIDRVLAVQKS